MQELRFWIYVGLLIACIGTGVVRLKKLTTPFLILLLSIIVTLQSELAAHFVAMKFKNNLILYHFFTPLHFIFFALIFYHLFMLKSSKYLLLISSIIFLVFSIVNSMYFQQQNQFPTYTLLLESFLLSLFAIRLSYDTLHRSDRYNFMNNSVFWLNAAIIVFYTSCVVFFGSHNLLVKIPGPLLKNLYLLLWFLNILMYAGFMVALMLDKPASTKENTG